MSTTSRYTNLYMRTCNADCRELKRSAKVAKVSNFKEDERCYYSMVGLKQLKSVLRTAEPMYFSATPICRTPRSLLGWLQR